jgi:tripartite-type tricarboxylate transporter receptor subunit TctC
MQGLIMNFFKFFSSLNMSCFIFILSALIFTSSQSVAQTQIDINAYPTQPIKIVVPYPPGGGTDFFARLLAEKAQSKWGQTVIVDNRSGAGGNVGAESVFRANADGYTLLFSANAPLVSNKSLYAKMNFDPDLLTPVSLMITGYSVLLVNPRLPVNTVPELIAYAKLNPNKLNYASQGIGNPAHLSAELFCTMAGIKMTHIPYKGTGPALADTLSGQVEVYFGELATSAVHVKAGKLKLLAVGGEKRLPDYANVPTIGEFLPKYLATYWSGMVGPPGMPLAISRKWAGLINEVLKNPEVLKKLQDMSMVPAGGSPEDMAQFMREDRERWSAVIKASGARAD